MTWRQAERAVMAGKPIRHKYWGATTRVVLWRGHLIKTAMRGNRMTRRWFKPNPFLSQRGWEVVE